MKNIFIAATVFLLAGCTTTSGPTPVINSKGLLDTASTTGLSKKFIDSHSASFTSPTDANVAMGMAKNGFALVKANCNDFFWSAGETQKWLLFSKDTVGAIGTLASGVLALHTGRTNAAGTVALVTGTAFAGLDIYTKNFLFAAENITSVQALTNNALDAHSEAVMAARVNDYAEATTALIANQNICSPMFIASLARDAIKNGKVIAANESGALKDIRSTQDQAVLERLGALLNPPGPISMNQAGGFWWLLKRSNSLTERKDLIYPLFAGLPDAGIPITAAGALKPGFSLTAVSDNLALFSATSRATFDSAIDATKAAIEKQKVDATNVATAPGTVGVAAPTPPPVAPPNFFSPNTGPHSNNFVIKVQ